MNNHALRIYSLTCAVILAIGETAVLFIDPNKPFPLAADDYLVVAGLLFFARKALTQETLAGLTACWAFACGNLWVILIVRMEGDGERLAAVTGALIAAAFGLFASAKNLRMA